MAVALKIKFYKPYLVGMHLFATISGSELLDVRYFSGRSKLFHTVPEISSFAAYTVLLAVKVIYYRKASTCSSLCEQPWKAFQSALCFAADSCSESWRLLLQKHFAEC